MADTDPVTSFHFAIDFDGADPTAFFTELGGVTSELDVIDFRSMTADGKSVIKKIPGKSKPPTITLKRGVTSNADLWGWHQQAVAGDVDSARRSGSLIFYDSTGSAEVTRWNFTNAWPSKLTVGTAKADSNEVTIEEITIVCEELLKP